MTRANHRCLSVLVLTLLTACPAGEKTIPGPDPEPGDGDVPEALEPCPEGQPKLGDRCGYSDGTSCTFPNGQCTNANGVVYQETINYCCIDSIWSTCGGYSPCEAMPLPAPIGDAAAGEAGRDGGASDVTGDGSISDLSITNDSGDISDGDAALD
jgi:hypothetical protein